MFAQAKANAPCILFIDQVDQSSFLFALQPEMDPRRSMLISYYLYFQIDVLAPSRGSTHTTENSGDRIVTGLLTGDAKNIPLDASVAIWIVTIRSVLNLLFHGHYLEMDGFFSASSRTGAEVDVLVLAGTDLYFIIRCFEQSLKRVSHRLLCYTFTGPFSNQPSRGYRFGHPETRSS